MIIAKRPRRYDLTGNAATSEFQDAKNLCFQNAQRTVKEYRCTSAGQILAPGIHAYRILSTQIAELSFIPLVARDQSPLPCLSNQMLSSRILCGSKLSRTSSGNHCRSDPVQVQSTVQPAKLRGPIFGDGRTCVSDLVLNAEENYAMINCIALDHGW